MKIGVYTFHDGKEPKDLENEIKKLKELLKLARSSVDYHCALCREYTDGKILIAKIDEVLK